MITLIIDEERAKVLQFMLNAAMNDNLLEFLQKEHSELLEVFGDFVDEWCEKVHEKDWCVDDECDYEPKKDKE